MKVVDNIGVSRTALQRAATVAQRVFRGAGVETVWIVCAAVDEAAADTEQDTACYQDPSDLYVHVVRSAGNPVFPARSHTESGVALYGENGVPGKYSYVFYDRVESEAEIGACSMASLLGLVMAHEVGHLLLGKGHGTQGVMTAQWNRGTEEKIARGMLTFSVEETRRLQTAARGIERRKVVDLMASLRGF